MTNNEEQEFSIASVEKTTDKEVEKAKRRGIIAEQVILGTIFSLIGGNCIREAGIYENLSIGISGMPAIIYGTMALYSGFNEFIKKDVDSNPEYTIIKEEKTSNKLVEKAKQVGFAASEIVSLASFYMVTMTESYPIDVYLCAGFSAIFGFTNLAFDHQDKINKNDKTEEKVKVK